MNIDEMPSGRELDYLVATKIMHESPPDKYIQEGNEWVNYVEDVWEETRSITTYRVVWPDNYSTDIAAAWQIVEKLNMAIIPISDDGWHDDGTYEYPKRSGWVAFVEATQESIYAGQWGTFTPMEIESHFIISDTPPLAICRTALKVVLHDT